jgi:hypothetical protein
MRILKFLGQKLFSALLISSITIGLFFILFLGIKYSSSFKNEVVIKASDFGVNSKISASQEVFNLPQIEKLPANFLQSTLPNLNNYNLSQKDIENISQALNISATSTKTQLEGIKMIQSKASSIFKDNPGIAEIFNFPALSDSSIKIDNSKDAGEKYLREVSEYFKKDLPENPLPPQLFLLLKILQKNPGAFPDINLKNIDLQDPQLDKFLNLNLDLYIKSYGQLLNDIKSLALPASWVDLHKQEILTLQITISSLTAVKEYPEDQLVALFAVQALNETANQLNNKIIDFQNSLKTNWVPQN